MKFVTYRCETPLGWVCRLGALDGDEVIDLTAAYETKLRRDGVRQAEALALVLVPPSLLDLLRLEEQGLEAARVALDFARSNETPRFRVSEVRLLAPLPRPNSIRDFMVVEEHVKGSFKGDIPQEWYDMPIYYKGNPDSVLGPDDDVHWPQYTEKLDYELEVCAVIGKQGRNISEQDAPSFIAGYSIFNDWSARDIQFREMKVGLGPALGKDFATSIGPCLVTPDEIDIYAARMEARVNGEIWSSGTLGAMRFSFAEIIAYLSQEQTLMPGDVLGSGTVGRGCGLELNRWIQPGDVVELEVQGIGILRNRIVRSLSSGH